MGDYLIVLGLACVSFSILECGKAIRDLSWLVKEFLDRAGRGEGKA